MQPAFSIFAKRNALQSTKMLFLSKSNQDLRPGKTIKTPGHTGSLFEHFPLNKAVIFWPFLMETQTRVNGFKTEHAFIGCQ